ncbi:MAG: ester cyclase [Chloroflexi bacterium]|nr:ester cyclase [Chloroflexota bacterium]
MSTVPTVDPKGLYLSLTRALNSKNLDALDELLTPDFVDHGQPAGTPPGVESFKAFRRMADAALLGSRATIEDLFSDGERACARITVRGTHAGPFMGIPASGCQVAMSIIEIIHVRDGRIAERWGQRDWLGLFAQIGVDLPALLSKHATVTDAVVVSA